LGLKPEDMASPQRIKKTERSTTAAENERRREQYTKKERAADVGVYRCCFEETGS
jgi:hypothetical protein